MNDQAQPGELPTAASALPIHPTAAALSVPSPKLPDLTTLARTFWQDWLTGWLTGEGQAVSDRPGWARH